MTTTTTAVSRIRHLDEDTHRRWILREEGSMGARELWVASYQPNPDLRVHLTDGSGIRSFDVTRNEARDLRNWLNDWLER